MGFGGGWGATAKIESAIRIANQYDDKSGLQVGLVKSFALSARASISLSASALAGEDLEGPDCQGGGYESRAALGTSYNVFGREGFVNVETARRTRGSLCDRTLAEATAGIDVVGGLKLLAKAYSEDGDGAHSTKAEASLLYDFGPVSLGLGWRQEVSGHFEEKGWVLSALRKF